MKKCLFLLALSAVCCGNVRGQEDKFPVQLFCPQPEMLYKQSGDFPFAYFWRRDFIDIRKFEKLLVKPVADKFWLTGSEKDNQQMRTELQELSKAFLQELGKAVDSEGKMIELRMTDKADEKTMVLEIALVPAMPLNDFRRLLNYQSSMKFSGVNLPYGMLCRNLTVIEAVVRDGGNNEPVAQMAGLCGTAKDAARLDEKAWPEAARKLLVDWSMKFVSTIKAELNRGKDGAYLSISGKLAAPAADKEKKK